MKVFTKDLADEIVKSTIEKFTVETVGSIPHVLKETMARNVFLPDFNVPHRPVEAADYLSPIVTDWKLSQIFPGQSTTFFYKYPVAEIQHAISRGRA